MGGGADMGGNATPLPAAAPAEPGSTAPKFTLEQLAADLGMTVGQLANYWLWLGVPARDPDIVAYSDADREALAELTGWASALHLDDAALRSLVRSMGYTSERMATWQLEALIDNEVRQGDVDDATARRLMIEAFPRLEPLLLRQFAHAWRWATGAVLRRYESTLEAQDDEGADAGLMPLRPAAIGFADIVGFTSRTATLPAEQLSAFLQEFESRARDVITASGGRVVKTIGDAVMFLSDTINGGAEIALALADARASGGDEGVSVRVGMVWGRILARFGDVFGPAVNLAARLTGLAEPDTVLIDPGTAALLAGDERYKLAVMPEADIKGLGTMRPVRLGRNLNFEGG